MYTVYLTDGYGDYKCIAEISRILDAYIIVSNANSKANRKEFKSVGIMDDNADILYETELK